MAGLGTTEILIIAVVIMVLFGAKRLPDASRSLGRSMRIFKAETKGLRDDDTSPDLAAPPVVPPPAMPPVAPPAPPVAPPVVPPAGGSTDGSTDPRP